MPQGIGYDPASGQIQGAWTGGNAGTMPGGSSAPPPSPAADEPPPPMAGEGQQAPLPYQPAAAPAPAPVSFGGAPSARQEGIAAARAPSVPAPPPDLGLSVTTTGGPEPAPQPETYPGEAEGRRDPLSLTEPYPAEQWYAESSEWIRKISSGESSSGQAIQELMATMGQTPEGMQLLQTQIIPSLIEAGQTRQMYQSTMQSAMANFQDPVEAAAHERIIAQRPDYEQMMDSGLDPLFQEQTRRSMEAMDRQAAAMGLTGSTAQAEMKQSVLMDLAREQARQERVYQMELLQEQKGYEDSILKAAGQEGQATSRWYQDIGQFAARVEELGIMSADVAGKLAGSMDRDSFNRIVEAANAATSTDQMVLNGIMTGGMNAAQVSSVLMDAQRQLFDQTIQATGMSASALMGVQEKMIADIQMVVDAINSGNIAGASEALNQVRQDREDSMEEASLWVQLARSFAAGGAKLSEGS